MFSKIKTLLKNDTVKNGSLFSLFSFLNKGINFLLLLVLANFIAPAEYGYLNLFNTVVMIVGYFIVMSSEGYLSVSFFRDGKDAVPQCISSSLFTSLISGGFFLLLLFVGGNSISGTLKLPRQLLYSAVLICFFSVFFRMILNYYRIKKKIFLYGIFSCCNALLYFALAIFFVKTVKMGWQGCVLSQLGSCVLFGMLAIGVFWQKKFFCIPSVDFWKRMLLWGIPLIPHLATNFFRQGCDRYIINYFHGVEDVGLFSFAFNLTNVIIMVGMGYNDSNSVELFEILGNKNVNGVEKKRLVSKQRKMIFKVYLVSSIIILVLGVSLTPIVLPKYGASVSYFAILAIYGFFHCLYFLYTNFLFFYKKNKILMHFTFSSAVLHLLLSLVFTRYSLYTTCFIYCFSQLIVVLLVRKYANNLLRKEIES